MTEIVKPEQICSLCRKGNVVADIEIGELICNNCGFVLLQRIEESGPERVFSYDDKNSRVGSPNSLARHDMGLATIIGTADRDAFGHPLSSSTKYTVEKLRKWDGRTQFYTTRSKNFREAFLLLDRLKDSLWLSDTVIEQTAYIYRKAVDKHLVNGRTIAGILAASLYAACRYTETPRSLKDVSKEMNIKRKTLAKCYRLILNELDLKMPVADPVKCIARIASKTGMNEKIKRKALKIIKRAADLDIVVGKDPMGFAASSLYFSCMVNGGKITQKEIARAAMVSEVTLRNRYKEMKTKFINTA